MTNVFKSLDTLFPCGKDRIFGEVVTVTIRIVRENSLKGEVSWKRKLATANASVNAWHMHRGICRKIDDEYSSFFDDSKQLTSAKKFVAFAIAHGYIYNWMRGDQRTAFVLDISGDNLALWHVFSGGMSGIESFTEYRVSKDDDIEVAISNACTYAKSTC